MNEIAIVNKTELVAQPSITADLFNSFISYLDASPKTVETYTRDLKQLFKYLQERDINRPQREDILAFKAWLAETGHKPSTIQNYVIATRLFFGWTAQEGLYPNIAEHIKGAKLDRDHKKDALTAGQAKELLESIERETAKGKRDYAIMALMITGGLRTVEVARADVEDFRNAGDAVALYIQGKGREEKTEYVKIAPAVEKAIRAYLRTRDKTQPTDPLFTSTSNNSQGQRLTTRSVSEIAKDRLRQAGYDSSRLSAHSMRHTAVTLSLLAGKDVTEVQQFARHANIATTMIYSHHLDKAKNSCSSAVADAIF